MPKKKGQCVGPFYEGFQDYRRKAIKAAKDLGYGEDIIQTLKNAATDQEVSQLMMTARKNRR